MFHNYPDIVSVAQVMQMLGIGKSSVYNLLKSKQLQHVPHIRQISKGFV